MLSEKILIYNLNLLITLNRREGNMEFTHAAFFLCVAKFCLLTFTLIKGNTKIYPIGIWFGRRDYCTLRAAMKHLPSNIWQRSN